MSRVSLLAVLISFVAVAVQAETKTIDEMLAEAPPIIKVEEDWEFVVGDPDPNLDCPQIVTVFGPTDANFGTHVVFELNHGTMPSFGEGGMQLQVWWNEWLIGYKRQRAPAELSSIGEVVRYTTVTQLAENNLMMYIKDGTSISWGEFGEVGSLFIKLYTLRDDLNPYDHNNSIRHSRVTFGANRVNRFRRRAIRFYSADGLYAESTTSRYVHRLATDVLIDDDEASTGGTSTDGTTTDETSTETSGETSGETLTEPTGETVTEPAP